jgi:ABC-type branched-subunit amino acid transport system permease subunit
VLSHGFNKGLPVAFPESLASSAPLLRIGLISVLTGQVWTLAIGVLAVSGFFLLLYRTRPGRAFRAIAEDPNGARLVGIPLLSTGLASYALSGLLGGIIAVLLAMLLGSASPGLGEQVAHKVLAVSIIAGLGNLVGGLASVLLSAGGDSAGHVSDRGMTLSWYARRLLWARGPLAPGCGESVAASGYSFNHGGQHPASWACTSLGVAHHFITVEHGHLRLPPHTSS